jgi:hypothetical protein
LILFKNLIEDKYSENGSRVAVNVKESCYLSPNKLSGMSFPKRDWKLNGGCFVRPLGEIYLIDN